MNNQKKKMKKKHNISLLSRKLTLLSENLSKTRNLSLAFLPQFHIDFKDTYHRLKGTSIHSNLCPIMLISRVFLETPGASHHTTSKWREEKRQAL